MISLPDRIAHAVAEADRDPRVTAALARLDEIGGVEPGPDLLLGRHLRLHSGGYDEDGRPIVYCLACGDTLPACSCSAPPDLEA